MPRDNTASIERRGNVDRKDPLTRVHPPRYWPYMFASKLAIVLAVASTASACTRWSSSTSYMPPREVARRLLGSPAVAETKSSSLNAGFAGSANRGSAVAGLGANTESLTLKHCVQQAELTFEQQFETRSDLRGRGWDIAGSVLLGLSGVSLINAGYSNDQDYYNVNREYDPTANYVVGGVMLAGAVALMVRSYVLVPNRRPAPPPSAMRTFQENKLVESTGCGLPGDLAGVQSPVPIVIQTQAAPAPQGDATTRLQQLDKLKASGAISDADYKRKRKEIIDSI